MNIEKYHHEAPEEETLREQIDGEIFQLKESFDEFTILITEFLNKKITTPLSEKAEAILDKIENLDMETKTKLFMGGIFGGIGFMAGGPLTAFSGAVAGDVLVDLLKFNPDFKKELERSNKKKK